MNANARDRSLRPQRGLPVEFHRLLPTTRLHLKANRRRAPIRITGIPKSRQTIVTAPKRANSRLFTDCYPFSAAFAPIDNQIRARRDRFEITAADHEMNN